MIEEDHAEDEGYFASMTDMMVGMLFIFILLLLSLALQLREEKQEIVTAEQSLQKTQREMMEELEEALLEAGVAVEILPEEGILRLPDSILFESGEYRLKPEGETSVKILSEILLPIIACYTRFDNEATGTFSDCEKTRHAIEAIFVEGHTDDTPFGSDGGYDNWNLSADRATFTHRAMVGYSPGLLNLKNSRGFPVLSVSSYAHQRPVSQRDDDNRRIDIRILMEARRPDILNAIDGAVAEAERDSHP